MFFLCLLLFAAWLAYKYANYSYYNYWKIKGVPQVDGSYPIGSSPNIVLSKRYQGQDVQEYYNKLSPHPFGGYYTFTAPTLLVRDPELLQHVLIKDFSNFRNRFKVKNLENHRFLDQNLFSLEGDKWRMLRVKLTPTFTSGKLKQMFGIFEECSKQLEERISQDIKMSDIFDVKMLISKFTLDIIMSCAFGIELNAMQNEESHFAEIGRITFPKTKPFYRNFLAIVRAFAPGLFKRLPTMLPQYLEQFLKNSISRTMKYREENNLKRNDFLNLLIDLKNKGYVTVEKGDEQESEFGNEKTQDIEITPELIVAQCFIFFLAGFETSSSVQTTALFELAINQDIQDKLRQEVKEALDKNGNKITYQSLIEMKYLDRVIKETLRKYPTLPFVTRMCVKKYKMPKSDVVIDEGTSVIIPIYALHHDPKYFPEPDKFDPERFSEANEGKIKPCTYMPFGEGPRLCIGMRFGLLQTKMGLVTILSKFKVLPSKETVNPIQFSATPVVTTTSHPVALKFERL